MSNFLDLSDSSSSELKQSSYFQIIGEFHVKNDSFFIVCLKDYPGDDRQNSSDLSSNILDYSKVGEVEIDGHFYAIVKAKNIVDNVEPNLTTLLTERELQIAAFVALGWSNKQVASQLCISEWTVGTHLRRIFIKLGVDSRAAMTYRCASLIHKLHQLGKIPHRTSTGERFSRPYIQPD